ncbi:MAG: sulfurtransferase [Rickettsiales bacterium]|nr:sulfurtransferase [Rickettsiales bacterium]|tara:strand:- start:1587 stop:2009 length:423 start_codon:yes stop_codon:yes gene_type:complete
MDLDYAGNLTPQESWDILEKDENSYLVDCRTSAEWSFVGVPDLESIKKKVIFIEWQTFPIMEKNPKFLKEISDNISNKESKIIFLCRSGARSRSAAEFLTSQGYENCYNCSDGFEGTHNETGHRGRISGWKFADLPWKQG